MVVLAIDDGDPGPPVLQPVSDREASEAGANNQDARAHCRGAIGLLWALLIGQFVAGAHVDDLGL